MKKTASFLLCLLVWAGSYGQSHREFPFDLRYTTDGTILAFNAGLMLMQPVLKRSLQVPSGTELTTLSREDLFILDRLTYRSFDNRSERASHYNLLATMGLSGLLALEVKRFSPLAVMAVMGIETYLTTYHLIGTLKLLSRRPRPEVYSENYNPMGYKGIESLNSFPSGHAALAFAAAGFVHSCYKAFDQTSLFAEFLLYGTYTAALSSGFLRYYSGVHHLTDVLAGASIGWTIGYLIPRLHLKNDNRRSVFEYSVSPLGVHLITHLD